MSQYECSFISSSSSKDRTFEGSLSIGKSSIDLIDHQQARKIENFKGGYPITFAYVFGNGKRKEYSIKPSSGVDAILLSKKLDSMIKTMKERDSKKRRRRDIKIEKELPNAKNVKLKDNPLDDNDMGYIKTNGSRKVDGGKAVKEGDLKMMTNSFDDKKNSNIVQSSSTYKKHDKIPNATTSPIKLDKLELNDSHEEISNLIDDEKNKPSNDPQSDENEIIPFDSVDTNVLSGLSFLDTIDVEYNRGIINEANNCYINSSLQALMHIKTFRTHLFQPYLMYLDRINKEGILCAIREMYFSDDSVMVPKKVKEAVAKRNSLFANNGQQDAHEFLESFLDYVSEELEPGLKDWMHQQPNLHLNGNENLLFNIWKGALCPINNNFGGFMMKYHVCNQCEHIVENREYFLTIPLALDNTKVKDGQPIMLTDLIHNYFQDEDIERQCEKCNFQKTTVKKKLVQLPKVLSFYLLRHKIDSTSSYKVSKMKTPVSFENTITIRDIVTPRFSKPFDNVQNVLSIISPPKRPLGSPLQPPSHESEKNGDSDTQDWSFGSQDGSWDNFFEAYSARQKNQKSRDNDRHDSSKSQTEGRSTSVQNKIEKQSNDPSNNIHVLMNAINTRTCMKDEEPISTYEYQIQSIIHHRGEETTSGHYITNVKTEDGWICCDDSVVSKRSNPISEPRNIDQSTSYIFFYVHNDFSK